MTDYQPIDILKFETGMSYEKKTKEHPAQMWVEDILILGSGPF